MSIFIVEYMFRRLGAAPLLFVRNNELALVFRGAVDSVLFDCHCVTCSIVWLTDDTGSQ